jgi:hypothetical protein
VSETRHRERKLIDRHFSGRSTPAAEASLRAHLDGCGACRAYYDRHLVLAGLDPAAPTDAARLAPGLGFTLPPRPARLFPLRLAVAAAAMAVVAFMVIRQRAVDPEFTARGAGRAAPALHIWRTLDRTTNPAVTAVDEGASIAAAGEELTFSYENPTDYTHLMILGVDEYGHVYWYHPDAEADTVAIAIAAGGGPHKLTVGIVQAYEGHSLRVLSLWATEPLATAKVAGLVDAAGCDRLRTRLPGVLCLETRLAVQAPAGGAR